jgi:hypothetical protein
MAEFWLHYVGTRLYSDIFVREAKRKGVQRATPFNMLGCFEFGTPILVAYFKKPSTAQVFGYFTVEGLTTTLPSALFAQVLSQLEVKNLDAKPKAEVRACGSYIIGACAEVNNSLAEIVAKIKEVCAKAGVNPAAYKWFLNGSFKMLEPFEVTAKFTRSYMRISLDITVLESAASKQLRMLEDYQKRRYLSQKDKDALLSQPLVLGE